MNELGLHRHSGSARRIPARSASDIQNRSSYCWHLVCTGMKQKVEAESPNFAKLPVRVVEELGGERLQAPIGESIRLSTAGTAANTCRLGIRLMC